VIPAGRDRFRLGLRCAEVTAPKLADVDWRGGESGDPPEGQPKPAGEPGGPHWDRTSDLFGVNEWQEGQ
jgi:hypothetical protein